jgi:hypothetical protein
VLCARALMRRAGARAVSQAGPGGPVLTGILWSDKQGILWSDKQGILWSDEEGILWSDKQFILFDYCKLSQI